MKSKGYYLQKNGESSADLYFPPEEEKAKKGDDIVKPKNATSSYAFFIKEYVKEQKTLIGD